MFFREGHGEHVGFSEAGGGLAEDELLRTVTVQFFHFIHKGPLPWVPQEWPEGAGLQVCCQDLPLSVKSSLAFERQQHDGPGTHPLG